MTTALSPSVEVGVRVEAGPVLDIAKGQHPAVGVDEEDDEDEAADVEEGRHRDDERRVEDLDGLETLKHTAEPQHSQQSLDPEYVHGPQYL